MGLVAETVSLHAKDAQTDSLCYKREAYGSPTTLKYIDNYQHP